MMFWIVKSVVTLVFGMVMFGCIVLLHECGGLRGGIAAFHGMACMGDGWCCLIHPHLSPLPSRERGRDATHPAVDTALKPV